MKTRAELEGNEACLPCRRCRRLVKQSDPHECQYEVADGGARYKYHVLRCDACVDDLRRRDEAARVLMFVSQLAALKQGQRLAWVAVQGALAGAPVPCADCGGLGFKKDRIDLTCARCGGTGRKGVTP